MVTALAEGAEVNGSVSEEEGRTALIGAAVGVRRHQLVSYVLSRSFATTPQTRLFYGRCLQGSLLACEFLLQNGANINHRDLRGRGALHAAATAGHTG